MKRRLLSISLALALCLTLLPTAARAAGESGGGDTDPGGDAGELENTRVFTWGALISAINGNYSTIILSGDKQEITRGDGEELKISGEKELTIDLNGHSLNTSGTRIAVSSGATLTIENDPDKPEPGTITGGSICVKAGGTLTITQGEASDGATEPGVTITGNTAPDGGGIYAAGTVTIGGNAKITGNSASKGGIYVADGGNVTIQANVEITGNEATGTGDNGLGGGVYNAGTFTMNGGAIYGNSAGEAAADFYNAPGGKFTLALADGYDWYEDKPDKRYTGTQTPCTNPETGSEAEEATYLAAEVPLTWDTVGEDTVFMIYDAAQLAAFLDIVNGSNGEGAENPAADAKLMKDITIYEDLEALLDENGNPKDDSGLVSWEPIGTSQYFGTFDGNGYTISGLYCDISDDGFPYAGLFSSVNDDGSGNRGTVRNLNVADSFVSFSGNGAAGGICGQNHGAITGCTFSGTVRGGSSMSTVGGVCGFNNSTGTIENCWNTGAVTAAGSTSRKAGGVCGQNDGAVRNCLNTGDVTTSGNSTSDHAGGVCGYNQSSVNENSGIVENCLNTGEVTATGSASYAGGVCGSNYGTVTHCYWLNTACDNGIGSSDDQQKATPKTSEQLASGEVAYLLNTDNNTKPWRQNLDNDKEKDLIPVLEALDPGHGAVYPIKNEESGEIARYSNYPGGKRTISGCTVTLSTNTFTYNGKVQKPEVTVVWEKNTTLIEGTDYTVTFSGNCIDAGTYTITITGIGQYTGTATATYTIKAAETGGNTGGSSSSGGSHRPARDDGPSTGASDGWKDIREEIRDAEDGDTITIDMGDETEVPGEIFEEVAGKDVTVEFELEDGVSWTVNGQDIPTDTGLSDLDLGVSMDSRGIPVNVFNAITGEYSTVQFTLSHDGPFGFTLTLAAPLGRDNAGYWANLYYYNEKGRELEFRQAARIGRDGRAEFRMDHASQYAVVIDDKSHEPEPLPFSDVPEDHWAYDAIQYVYGEGLMAGTGETTFSPNGTTTRGQIVTIPWRLAGSPQVNYLMDFSDVDPAAWYGEAVRWASSLRIASGYGDGRFGPDDPITREQLAVMLYQYAWNMGYDLTGGGMALREFADYEAISPYALEALDWAVHTGLLGGKGGGILDPTGGATRAQAAQILMNFCAHAAE